MRKIEDFMNYLADMDGGWWPVLFLRPARDQDINNAVILKISLLFGSPAGLLFFYLFVVRRYHAITVANLAVNLIFGIIIYFILYKVSFAYFWNRRARRIRGE